MNTSFLIVTFVAFLTPMLLARFKVGLIPTSVVEIIVGIIIGRSALNLVQPNMLLNYCSTLGVLILMFLSGMEIDFSLFRRNVIGNKQSTKVKFSPVKTAILAFLISAVSSFILAVLFKMTGLFNDIFLTTILFMTVSLGIVISLLKENELLSKKYGQTVLLFAVLGEVIPMLSLTVYSSMISKKGSSIWLILLLFVVAALLVRHFRSFFVFFDSINKATTQVDIRLAVFIIMLLVWLAEFVGAENILGAFVAGIVFKLLQPAKDTERRLDSIGYGYLIPFFFIMTGVKLNIPELLNSKTALILIPLFFVAYFLAKLPAYYGFKLSFSKQNSIAASMLLSTTITLVLAVLTVASSLKVVTNEQAGAFILAGVLTCIIGPLFFNNFYKLEENKHRKTRLHFIGANIMTVSAAQQLSKNWYDVTLFTDYKKNYTTYKPKANIKLVESIEANTLISRGAFDTDVLVLGHVDPSVNYKLAIAAKEYGTKRVITRLATQKPKDDIKQEEKFAELNVEYYSSFDVRVGILRAMIESPSTMDIITSGEARLYETTVNDELFDGTEVYRLPFIDEITISRIVRNKKTIAPHGKTKIRLGDHIIYSASKEVSAQLREKLERLNSNGV